jgi:hypothetical protein
MTKCGQNPDRQYEYRRLGVRLCVHAHPLVLGVTQQHLAEDLAIGVATIQGWESGADRWMAVPAGKFLALRSRLRHL